MKYGISTLLGLILLAAIGIAVYRADPKIWPWVSTLVAVPFLARRFRAPDQSPASLMGVGALSAFLAMEAFLVLGLIAYYVCLLFARPDPDPSAPSHEPLTIAAILILGYGGGAAVVGAVLGMMTSVLRTIMFRWLSSRQSDGG